MAEPWTEIADRVYVRRHAFFDMNVTLVAGDERAVVADTRTTHAQGRELLAAVRTLTGAPLTVVNTHAHFDHFFGNAAFRPAPILGHRRCAEVVAEHGEQQRADMIAHAREKGDEQLAAELAEVEITAPDEVFDETHTLDLGGRTVTLRYLGRGHTDNDIVVTVPDAGVLLAGDLVEEGAPPQFGDAYPLEWPGTAARLLELADGPVVPGHGAVVDAAFVRAQQAQLTQLADLARRAHAAGATVADALPEAPFPARFARPALERAFAHLDGRDPEPPPHVEI